MINVQIQVINMVSNQLPANCILTEHVWLVHGMYYVEKYVVVFHIRCARVQRVQWNCHVHHFLRHHLTLCAAEVLDEPAKHLTSEHHSQRQPMPKSMPYYTEPNELLMLLPVCVDLPMMNTVLALERSFVLATSVLATHLMFHHYLNTIHLDNSLFDSTEWQIVCMHKRKNWSNLLTMRIFLKYWSMSFVYLCFFNYQNKNKFQISWKKK